MPLLEKINEATGLSLTNPFDSSGGLTNFYETFYNSFLTTANALPINSMWFVTIDQIPNPSVLNTILSEYENDRNKHIKTYQKAQEVNRKVKGIIIAQGVKVTGDSIEVSRKGTKNTGYIQGLIGEGRTPFPSLNIAFLENNVSFVDYTLRPWQIAVSHKSLKEQTLKTTISVMFLSRTGPRRPLAKRKVVKYYNCCPININEEEYNYSGADMYRLRQVQFTYSHYTFESVEDTLLDLIKTSTGFFGDLVGNLQNELQRQFGANNVSQYINNLTARAATFGQNLLAGTAQNIVSNVAGSIQGRVDGAINQLTGNIANAATQLTGNINQATQNALDSLVGSDNPNTDTPTFKPIPEQAAGNVNTDTPSFLQSPTFPTPAKPTIIDKSKTTSFQDTPTFAVEHTVNRQGKPAKVDFKKVTSENDTPISDQIPYIVSNSKTPSNPDEDTVTILTPLNAYKAKPDPSIDDARRGQINHQDIEKQIPLNDIPDRKSIPFTIKSIDTNDVPKRP